MAAPSFSDSDFKKPDSEERMGGPRGATQVGETILAPEGEESPASYAGKSLAKGAAEQLGRNFEASVAATLTGPAGVPESILRMFLPRELVDKLNLPSKVIDPKIEEKDQATGEKKQTTVRKKFINKDAPTSPESLGGMYERGKAPGPMSEMAGEMLETAGATVANPLGGPMKLVRGALMALGSGAGASIGKRAIGGAGEMVGDLWDQWAGSKGTGKTGREVGEFVGSGVGGGVGAQANVTRGKIIGAAAKGEAALEEAAKAKARGELEDNFKDKYKGMSEKSRGFIQKWVNEKLATAMSKNVDIPDRISELEAAEKRLEQDGNKLEFDLSQRTADPSLLKARESQQPRNLKEAQELAAREQKREKEIVGLYEKNFGVKPDAKKVAESLEDYRLSTEARIKALEAEKIEEKNALPHHTPQSKAQSGEARDAMYEEQKNQAREVRDGWYAKIKTADAVDPHKFDPKGMEKDLRGILDTTLSKVGKDTVPESFVKIDNLLKRAKGSEAVIERVKNDKGIFETTVKSEGQPAKPITVDDMMDITQALNRERPRDAVEARNLAIVKEGVERAWKQAPKDTYEAYRKAQDNYQKLYAPMFKEGVNANLDKRAPRSREGEGYYPPDRGFSPYLSEGEIVTKMQQFDNLWGGGKIGPRVDKAYQELGREIQDRYHKDVFGGSDKFSLTKHDEFMRKWDPVFERVPWAREAIDRQAARVSKVQSDIAAQQRGYSEGARSPLNRVMEVEKADKLVASALTDPAKMNQLIRIMKPHGGTDALLNEVRSRVNIMRNGEFDPQAMEQVVKKSEPGLMALYTEAFGSKEAAAKQVQTLKDIALLAKRHAMGAQQMAPAARIGGDPIAARTGSSGASVMSYFRSTTQGYTSMPYIVTLASGRFLNRAMQNALQDAEKEAFTNPEMAKAVLELYTKQAGEQVTKETLKTVFSAARLGGSQTARQVMDWLVDRDYVLNTTAKGAQLGLTQHATEDE